jgi:1-aminocyclopropane-1-carboxylate deaminase/D-cysteine desulfhydrase-like pyridoxal-dependent ACC family enzyme
MPQSDVLSALPEIAFKEPEIVQLNDELFQRNGLQISMLRLDEIHPVVSGNKLFKLIYFLKEAKESVHKKIITFGGAYSNHLAATAFACEQLNLRSIGVVRGEKPEMLSHTLRFCLKHGMQLKFISRSLYKNIDAEFLQQLQNKYGEHILIPEGGFSVKGKPGAALINNYFGDKNFTHVCLPVGTATTFAGIVDSNMTGAEIIGFGVLKNLNDINERFKELKVDPSKKLSFVGDYHFGGYAKKTKELISFMNTFYSKHSIPLDFVYTGKMMFGVYDLIEKKFFEPGSKILCIHTGGLQGNDSLRKGELIF